MPNEECRRNEERAARRHDLVGLAIDGGPHLSVHDVSEDRSRDDDAQVPTCRARSSAPTSTASNPSRGPVSGYLATSPDRRGADSLGCWHGFGLREPPTHNAASTDCGERHRQRARECCRRPTSAMGTRARGGDAGRAAHRAPSIRAAVGSALGRPATRFLTWWSVARSAAAPARGAGSRERGGAAT